MLSNVYPAILTLGILQYSGYGFPYEYANNNNASCVT